MILSCAIQATINYFLSENQEYTPFIESNVAENRTFQ